MEWIALYIHVRECYTTVKMPELEVSAMTSSTTLNLKSESQNINLKSIKTIHCSGTHIYMHTWEKIFFSDKNYFKEIE